MKAHVTVVWKEEIVNEGIDSGKIYMRLKPSIKIKNLEQEQKDKDKLIEDIKKSFKQKR